MYQYTNYLAVAVDRLGGAHANHMAPGEAL